MSERDDLEIFAACLERLTRRRGVFRLDLGFGEVVTLVATIQLALRCPDFAGPTAREARGMVEQIIGVLEAEEPWLGEMLRKGFGPAHDVAREDV